MPLMDLADCLKAEVPILSHRHAFDFMGPQDTYCYQQASPLFFVTHTVTEFLATKPIILFPLNNTGDITVCVFIFSRSTICIIRPFGRAFPRPYKLPILNCDGPSYDSLYSGARLCTIC